MLYQEFFINKRFIIRILIFFFAFIWFTGVVSPCVDFNLAHINYPYLKIIYSNVCHQSPEKSFMCNAAHFLVCARCTGIYFSVLISSFVILFINKRLKIKTSSLILFSIPMLADVILHFIGVYKYSLSFAFVTGLLFGSAVFLYILSGIENSFYQKSKIFK